jgi:KTSC domain
MRCLGDRNRAMRHAAFDTFKTAPSRGTFFNHEIRDRYAFREVTRMVRPTIRQSRFRR